MRLSGTDTALHGDRGPDIFETCPRRSQPSARRLHTTLERQTTMSKRLLLGQTLPIKAARYGDNDPPCLRGKTARFGHVGIGVGIATAVLLLCSAGQALADGPSGYAF